MNPLAGVRRNLAVSLRAQVAGPEGDRRDREIWGKPGERWFNPEDPIWRVHLDASMFAGGIRALFLQTLHPLAMAGVADHSTYQDDAWGRLQRTATFIATTTYATVPDAERMLARIRKVHDTVSGIAEDGRAYAASDPDLLRWVHVAEIESFLTSHQHFGERPLTPAEADLYVAQAGHAASSLGATRVPSTVAELHRTIDEFRPDLQVTEAMRETVRFLLSGPEMPLKSKPGYQLLLSGAIGTLPTWSRELLGLPTSPAWARRRTTLGRLGTSATRWILSDPVASGARLSVSAQTQVAAR